MTHILVVEDGREICQLYMRVLTQATEASTGQEALDAIDKTYEVVLVNLSSELSSSHQNGCGRAHAAILLSALSKGTS